jgi:hypothetical protein
MVSDPAELDGDAVMEEDEDEADVMVRLRLLFNIAAQLACSAPAFARAWARP